MLVILLFQILRFYGKILKFSAAFEQNLSINVQIIIAEARTVANWVKSLAFSTQEKFWSHAFHQILAEIRSKHSNCIVPV